MKTSKIATIVYKNYTENVDMLNPLFSQKELDTLVKSDKDIIRVDYYENGILLGDVAFVTENNGKKWDGLLIRKTKYEDVVSFEGKEYRYITDKCFFDDSQDVIVMTGVSDKRSRLKLKVCMYENTKG